MPNKRCVISAALWAICLLGSGAAFPAACDSFGRQPVFGIEDVWESSDEGQLGRANFDSSCKELLECYGSDGAIKTGCDRVYEKNLKGACRKAFDTRSKPLGQCMETVNSAVEFVKQSGGETYRKMQRTARTAKREEERKAEDRKRQARADERRKKRKIYRLKRIERQFR
jgi:hypothetical protein